MRNRTFQLFWLCHCLAVAYPCFCNANTIHVPGDQTTIQQGIDLAEDGDTVLVAAGVYTGEGNYEIELLGKAIVVISAAGAEETVIDAEGIGRYGFYLHQDEDHQTVIKGFKVINVTAGNFFSSTGIYIEDSSPSIENCILENNGRGLFLEQTSAIISDCTISNNTTWGGIINRFGSSDAVIRNCLIVGNTSDVGGGIRVDVSPSPLYINCTIAGNNATQSGGGIFVSEDDLLRMRNCIIWGNTAPDDPNLQGYNFDITYSNIEGLCLPQKGNISKDPQFTDAAYHLALGSPCIDSASPADGLEADNTQANMGRYGLTPAAAPGNANSPIIASITPDTGSPAGGSIISLSGQRFGNTAGTLTIGSVTANIISWTDNEIQCHTPAHLPGKKPVEIETTDALSSGLPFGFQYEGKATLHVPAQFSNIQEAIYCAIDGDTVLVAPGIYTGTGNRDIRLLGKSIVVTSEAGAEQTTIDVEGLGDYGFNIHQGEDTSSVIRGFRIINAKNGAYLTSGIRISDGSPTISHCILENNARGILLEDTEAIIANCIIQKNTNNGGITSRFSTENATVKNCLIADNHSNGSGGGISVSSNSNPTFISCTIVGNTAQYSGGGVSVSSNYTLKMRNSILWGNSAPEAPNLSGYQFEVTYSNIEGFCIPQKGNLSEDPQFSDAAYHLSANSPCIDSGHPADGRDPDGTQINMGYDGGAPTATPGNPAAPLIETISPEAESPNGETTVTITGQHFGSLPGSVKFGGLSANISSWTTSEIRCTAPIHDPGFVTVVIETATSFASQLTFGYRYEGGAILKVPSVFPNIQAAINCAVDGDTVLVAPGIYTGPGNREIKLLGKAIAVIAEEGPEVTTIDVEGLGGSGFDLDQEEGPASLIQGFRIINADTGSFSDSGILLNNDASPVIRHCIIEKNARGIFMIRTKAVIEACIIRDNTTYGGILIRFSASDAIIKNCLITGNHSSSDGGGISNESSNSPLILNCNIIGNTSDEMGGGIATSTFYVLRMRNSIVWANTAASYPGIFADSALITYSDIQGGWPGEGNISQDPCFVNPFLEDYHLSPASPCIDTGAPGDDFSEEPQPNGGRINMGRYGNTIEASSFAAQMIIKDFSYEPGCEASRLISLSGRYFGHTQGGGKIWLGDQEANTIVLWTDTLIQFSAESNSIAGNSIILSNATGARDTVPAEQTYTPFVQYVEGEVSGVWTADCPGTYILTGNVVIPSGAKLVIEPGVRVLVDRRQAGNGASFTVKGSLEAMGTIEAPIQFSLLPYQANPGGWAGVLIDLQSGADHTRMRHCLVEYALHGITIKDSKTEMDSCIVQYSRDNGVYWDAKYEAVTGSLKNSKLIHNGGYGIKIAAVGRSSGSANASPQIYQNLIANNQKGGISISAQAFTPFSGGAFRSARANPTINNNIIQYNQGFGVSGLAEGDWADGIPFNFVYTAYVNPRLEGNLIANNRGGFRTITRPTGGTTWNSESEPQIINCTFANNENVGLVAGDSSIVRVTNSIIVGSSQSIEMQRGGRLEAAYSTILPQIAGEAMVEDIPQFFDEALGDFRLLATSAQIDAGQNEFVTETTDLQGNDRILGSVDQEDPKVDIGAYEYRLPQLITQSGNVTICVGETFLLEVEASGDELAYQWEKDGIPINTALSPTLEVVMANPEDAGTYTCIITDELQGQISSTPINVQVTPGLEVTLAIKASATEVCEGEMIQLDALVSNEGEHPMYTWSLNGETVSDQPSWSFDQFEDGDQVICRLESSANCVQNNQKTASVFIQVDPLPVPEINGTLEICAGETTTLVAEGGNTYQWDSGHNTAAITVGQAGNYAVTVTSEKGCSRSTAASLTVNELPTVSLNLERDTFCLGESSLLLAGGSPPNGIYSGPGITNGNTFLPEAAGLGNHQVSYTLTAETGCSNAVAQSIVVVQEAAVCNLTGLRQTYLHPLSIFPNPASRKVTVKWDDHFGKLGKKTLQIHNIQGQTQVVRKRISILESQTVTIDVRDLAAGIYLLSLWDGARPLARGKLVIF